MPHIQFRRLIVLPFLLACLAVATPAVCAPGGLFTTHTEGHIAACESCPAGRGLGGLARRATLVAKLRQAAPALLLDGGNAFYGGDETAPSPQELAPLVARAYARIGYDAVNLSYRDFRAGRD